LFLSNDDLFFNQRDDLFSAAAELTWSTFRIVNSRLRNRLTNERVEKLVFIYINSVLLDENDKNDFILEDGAVLSGTKCEEQHSLYIKIDNQAVLNDKSDRNGIKTKSIFLKHARACMHML
jgi:hypothetical protein